MFVAMKSFGVHLNEIYIKINTFKVDDILISAMSPDVKLIYIFNCCGQQKIEKKTCFHIPEIHVRINLFEDFLISTIFGAC